jgi:hypothetical protein
MLRHVRQLEDLVDVDVVVLAGVDQLHHELVVGDPEVAEAAQPVRLSIRKLSRTQPVGCSASSREYRAESAWSTVRIGSGEMLRTGRAHRSGRRPPWPPTTRPGR